MTYYNLANLHTISVRIKELEAIREQMQNASIERQKRYYSNLKKLGEEKKRLLEQDLLGEFELSPEDRIMAENYFYEGITWEEAAVNTAAKNLPLEVYDRLIADTKKFNAYKLKHKKVVLRTVKQFYNNYDKKGKENDDLYF